MISLKKILLIAFCSLLFSFVVHAQSPSEDLELSIRYFNKKVYYMNDDLLIKVSIKNTGSEPVYIKVAENHIFNIDFDVRTLTNIGQALSMTYLRDMEKNRFLLYRELNLQPGEDFGFVVPLKNYIELKEPGAYQIRAVFYPGLSKNKKLVSNTLSLSLRPSSGDKQFMNRLDEVTGDILRAVDMPPNEVVSYTLKGRQRENWAQFFLYLDLKSLIRNSPNLLKRYEGAPKEEQALILNEYKERLKTKKEPRDFPLIASPTDFEVLYTSYNNETAEVQVREVFEHPLFTEVKRYVYDLKRDQGVWKINRYSVQNIGTEPNKGEPVS